MISTRTLLSDSLNFIRNRSQSVLILIFAVVALDILITIPGWYFLPENAFSGEENFRSFWPNIFLSALLSILASAAIKSSIMRFLKSSSEGANLTAWDAIKSGIEFYPSFIALEILVLAALFLGSLALCAIIGIVSIVTIFVTVKTAVCVAIPAAGSAVGLTIISYVWLSWLLAPAIIVTERKSALKALAESRSLAKKCWKQLLSGSLVWSLPYIFSFMILFWQIAPSILEIFSLWNTSSAESLTQKFSWSGPTGATTLVMSLLFASGKLFSLTYNYRLYMQLTENNYHP